MFIAVNRTNALGFEYFPAALFFPTRIRDGRTWMIRALIPKSEPVLPDEGFLPACLGSRLDRCRDTPWSDPRVAVNA